MFEIKRKIASVLKNNGFRVVVDFRCPLGWIDVAGFKAGKSVGVEIGDPDIVAPKLFSHPFDVRVVISEKATRVRGVIVLERLEDFCKELNLECDVDYDDEAWRYRRAFDYLRRAFGDDKIARRAIDAVVFLYMAGEVVEDYSGKVRERIPFVKLFPTLVESGLAVRDTKEIFMPKTYMTSLTRGGTKLAKLVLLRKIEEKWNELDELVKDFGFWTVRIATLGLMDRRGLKLKKQNITVPEDLGSSFDEIFYSVLPVLMKTDLYELLKLLKTCDGYLNAFCRMMCYTVLYPKVEGMFERLFEMGLASKVPVYDYYGEFFGYEYRTSKEVANVLSKLSYTEVDGRILEKFESVLNAMMLRRSRDLEMAIEKGIVKEKDGGFGVLDERRFEDFVKMRLARVIAEYLSNISSSRAP